MSDGLMRRLWAQPVARVGGLIVLLLIVATIVGPLVVPYDPATQLDLQGGRLLPPSPAHPFGTDDLSRDLLSRVMWGARISLTIAVLSVVVALSVGTLVGCAAALGGPQVDALLMRLVDAALAVPRLLFLLVILVAWTDVGIPAFVTVLGLTSWFDVSRLVRAEVLSLRQRDYVLAARALGVGTGALLRRHVLPNIAAPVIVSGVLGVAQMVLLEAGLSFLGVGVRRPTPSWGGMIADSQDLMVTAWWTAAFPGTAIVVTVLSFSLLGAGLRAALDPKRP